MGASQIVLKSRLIGTLLSMALSQLLMGQSDQSFLVIPGNQDELYNISAHFYWLEDANNSLSIEEASSDTLAHLYQPLAKHSVDFGFSESYYWLRLKIRRDPTDSANYSIVFHESKTEQITFFYESENSGWDQSKAGYKVPISQKLLKTPIHIFPITFNQNQEVVYLRIKANGTQSRVSIEPWDELEIYTLKRNFYSGLFGGFLIIVIVYCLNLFISLKNRLFLVYAFVVLILTICNLSLDGSISYIHEVLGTSSVFLFAKLGHLANPAIQYYGILFLSLKKYAPRWLYKFHMVMLCVYLGTSVLTWFVPMQVGFFSMQAHGLFLFITLILTSIVVGFRGNRFAKYFTLGCLSYLLGICFEVLHWQGIIPSIGYLPYVSYGQVLEISIFTISLNQRIRQEKITLENEKTEANRLVVEKAKENEKIVMEQNRLLEEKVADRTRELHDSNLEFQQLNDAIASQAEELQGKNEQLKELNHLKDKFFSIISHDLRGPLRNLNMMLGMVQNDQISGEQMKALSKEISKSVHNLIELLDNLLHWAKNQLQESKVEISQIDLGVVINKNVELLRNYAKEKNIELTCNFSDKVLALADANMMDFIFRNLISNAIKFTPSGGYVKVTKMNTSEGLKISVEDSGVGIESSTLKKLFANDVISTPGTANEIGVGLGLQLAKEFVTQNKGNIEVCQGEERGSVFSVIVPTQ